MNAKQILNMVVYGAATTLGSIAISEGVQVVRDPYKKAKIKRKIRHIKNTFVKETES